MPVEINRRNRIIEVIRRGQRGLDGDVGLTTTVTKSTNHTALASERGYVFYCTAALTLSFEQAVTLTNGWHCIVDATNGAVVLDPDGSETINGLSTLTVPDGASALVYTDGTALFARFFYGSAYTALNGFPTATDKYLYSDGVSSWVEGDITAAGRALLDDADASAQRATLEINRGMEFIDSLDASSSPDLEFTGFDASKYDAYLFVLSNVVPATDNVNLWLQLSIDGGSTYPTDSGSPAFNNYYTQSGLCVDGGTVTGFSSTVQSGFVINSGLEGIGSGVSEDGLSGEVRVQGPHLTRDTIVNWQSTFVPDTSFGSTPPDVSMVTGGGLHNRGNVVDAARFIMSSGNIESGTITMYGIRNSI